MPKVKITTIDSFYDRWIWAVSLLQSPVLLAMRLYWGWQFFLAGKGKLENPDHFIGYLTSMDFPMPKVQAYVAACTECFGGLLLLAGLGSRLATVPLIFTMCVAYMTAHRPAVDTIRTNPDLFLQQAPFLFLLCSVIVLVFGPGVFSLDYVIAKLRGRTTRTVTVQQT